jgi:raffinose/stachyose/melibiose transport system permease protein
LLLGLDIPLLATMIRIYLIITQVHRYDSLGALILPSIALGIRLTVLILSNFIRGVPSGVLPVDATGRLCLLEDGLEAAFPLTRPAIVTVGI